MVSLLLNALVVVIGDHLNKILSGVGKIFIPVIDNILTFLITALVFAVIFKVLPDAKIKWKDVLIGGLITAVFFTLGKLAIGYYLGSSNITTVYGAAGSVMIIMIWVYYSAVIL